MDHKKALYKAAEDLFLELRLLLPGVQLPLTGGGHTREVSVPIPHAVYPPSQRCIMEHRVSDGEYGDHRFVLHLKSGGAISIGYRGTVTYADGATESDIQAFFTLWHTYATEVKALLHRLGQ